MERVSDYAVKLVVARHAIERFAVVLKRVQIAVPDGPFYRSFAAIGLSAGFSHYKNKI